MWECLRKQGSYNQQYRKWNNSLYAPEYVSMGEYGGVLIMINLSNKLQFNCMCILICIHVMMIGIIVKSHILRVIIITVIKLN